VGQLALCIYFFNKQKKLEGKKRRANNLLLWLRKKKAFVGRYANGFSNFEAVSAKFVSNIHPLSEASQII